MEQTVKNIDETYLAALQDRDKKNIDFWGINLTDQPGHGLAYKVYLAQPLSRNTNHPLLRFVADRGMLRYYEDVIRPGQHDAPRLDISLYQRSDDNVQALFDYLRQTVPFFVQYADQVCRLANMPITDQPGYHHAALYHVGSAEKDGCPERLKFHFFTRWCDDPNYHTRQGYRDAFYLDYLRNVGIAPYRQLTEQAELLLQNCGGHLWMAGIDLSASAVKYKLYLHHLQDAYTQLQAMLPPQMNDQLQAVIAWHQLHPECRLAGIALGLDLHGTPTLNLYYHIG